MYSAWYVLYMFASLPIVVVQDGVVVHNVKHPRLCSAIAHDASQDLLVIVDNVTT